MANPKVTVTLDADDRASGKVKKAQSAFAGFKDFLKTSFALTLTDVANVVRRVGDVVSGLVLPAAEAEAALNKTANAMKAAGTFSETSLAQVSAFAQQLSKTTGISDEAGLALFSLARSFTSTNREAAQLVTVAADFAVASGKGLEESVTAIAAAMNGATRGVAKFAPEIANLTDEQLRNGEATRILGERFKGLAAGELNTLQGQFTRNKNAVGELVEAFGRGLVGSFALKGAVADLNTVLESATAEQFAEKSGKAFRGLTITFLSFLPSVDQLLKGLQAITSVAAFLNPELAQLSIIIGDARKSFSDYATVADLADQAALGFTVATDKAAEALRKAALQLDNNKSGQQLLAEETARTAAQQKIYTDVYNAYLASVDASAQGNADNISGLLQTGAALDSVAGSARRSTVAFQQYTAAASEAATASQRFAAGGAVRSSIEGGNNPGINRDAVSSSIRGGANPGARFR